MLKLEQLETRSVPAVFISGDTLHVINDGIVMQAKVQVAGDNLEAIWNDDAGSHDVFFSLSGLTTVDFQGGRGLIGMFQNDTTLATHFEGTSNAGAYFEQCVGGFGANTLHGGQAVSTVLLARGSFNELFAGNGSGFTSMQCTGGPATYHTNAQTYLISPRQGDTIFGDGLVVGGSLPVIYL